MGFLFTMCGFFVSVMAFGYSVVAFVCQMWFSVCQVWLWDINCGFGMSSVSGVTLVCQVLSCSFMRS